jgi:predicted RNase H-like nuclease
VRDYGRPGGTDHMVSGANSRMDRQLLGLDGCKQGAWVAASGGPEFRISHALEPLLAAACAGELRMVLDVPIGLCASGRRCDREARALLKRRCSGVFTPPCREPLVGRDRLEASQLNFAASGKKIGSQAFGILPRIAAVDRLMQPELQECAHEGHPEVSFATIGGSRMAFAKRNPEGERERLAVLARAGLTFDPKEVRRQLERGLVARDDVIAAAVMLLTAMRIEAGRALDCRPIQSSVTGAGLGWRCGRNITYRLTSNSGLSHLFARFAVGRESESAGIVRSANPMSNIKKAGTTAGELLAALSADLAFLRRTVRAKPFTVKWQNRWRTPRQHWSRRQMNWVAFA